jgi:transcriptional regulator with XRE-family HTH domain
VSPFDIRSAKQIGKLLRSSREAQSANLENISKRCGLTVAQLVHIENGNLFAFESNLEKIVSYSNVYAQALSVDINKLSETPSMALNCCQFRATTKESFSIVNHCSNMG